MLREGWIPTTDVFDSVLKRTGFLQFDDDCCV